VQIVRQKEALPFLTDTPTSFAQLVDWMFPSSDKIKGAQILFPDTVFFEEGKPAFIARIDKEGCLVKVTQASKLGLQEIRQRFSTIVRERKRETGLFIPGAQENNASSTMTGTQAMQSFNMPLERQPSITGESVNYRDVAIIRYNRRPLQEGKEPADEDTIEHVKVVKDTELINEFRRRANDLEWLNFSCIQTCIKAKSIGDLIVVNFQAPVNRLAPFKEIEYGVHAKAMPDDLDLLKSGSPEDDDVFAQKQCYKIAHYIQKVHF